LRGLCLLLPLPCAKTITLGAFRDGQPARQAHHPDGDRDLLVADRRVVVDGARPGRHGRCHPMQEIPDLGVGHPVEVLVELADAEEPLRGLQAHQLVDLLAQNGGGIRCADRHRKVHPGRALRFGDLARTIPSARRRRPARASLPQAGRTARRLSSDGSRIDC
jgi:hypothetical protein